MAWSEQMPFENPAKTIAQQRFEKLEAERLRLLNLTHCKARKTRIRAKKSLTVSTHAALCAEIEKDKCL